MQQPVANQGVGAILAFSQQNGNLVWRNEVSTGSLDTAAIISPFALDSSYNTLYAGVSKVDGSANATIALHAQTGETLWQQPLNGGSSFFAAGGPTLFSLQGSDCRIAAVGRGNADGSYSCHNRRNGNLIWQTQVSERNEAGYFGISTTASIKGERPVSYTHLSSMACGKVFIKAPFPHFTSSNIPSVVSASFLLITEEAISDT